MHKLDMPIIAEMKNNPENDEKRKKCKKPITYYVVIACFLLPSLIPLLLFVIIPMLGAVWISFHSWNLIAPMRWVGLENYQNALMDPSVRKAFINTLLYLILYFPLVYVGGLGLAILLNSRLRGRSFFRSLYFLPVVTSWVVVALVWQWILNPRAGLVNNMLAIFGITGPGWWADPYWALPSVVLASVWKDLGFVMIILLAGLQSINPDLYSAASLDGAGWWRKLFSITLPMLSPSSFFVMMLSFINGFQVFDQVYVMTKGGPNRASEVVVLKIYDMTFRYGEAGMASALSMILFVVIMIITIIQLWGQKKWVNYDL